MTSNTHPSMAEEAKVGWICHLCPRPSKLLDVHELTKHAIQKHHLDGNDLSRYVKEAFFLDFKKEQEKYEAKRRMVATPSGKTRAQVNSQPGTSKHPNIERNAILDSGRVIPKLNGDRLRGDSLDDADHYDLGNDASTEKASKEADAEEATDDDETISDYQYETQSEDDEPPERPRLKGNQLRSSAAPGVKHAAAADSSDNERPSKRMKTTHSSDHTTHRHMTSGMALNTSTQQAGPSTSSQNATNASIPAQASNTNGAQATNASTAHQTASNAALTAGGNVMLPGSANFPNLKCDACHRSRKECHFRDVAASCRQCVRLGSTCQINGNSTAKSVWPQYLRIHPTITKSTWVPLAYLQADPGDRKGRGTRKGE